jgi:excisionase family DNA binding protein
MPDAKMKMNPDATDPLQRITVGAVDAAVLLSVSERTLADWTRDGLVPCIRIGSRVLYSPDALRAWAVAKSEATKLESKAG